MISEHDKALATSWPKGNDLHQIGEAIPKEWQYSETWGQHSSAKDLVVINRDTLDFAFVRADNVNPQTAEEALRYLLPEGDKFELRPSATFIEVLPS